MSKIPVASEIHQHDGEVIEAVAIDVTNFGRAFSGTLFNAPESTSRKYYVARLEKTKDKFVIHDYTIYLLCDWNEEGADFDYLILEVNTFGFFLKYVRHDTVISTNERVTLDFRNNTAKKL